MATPRKQRTDASPWPLLSDHDRPPGYEDVVIGLIPALQEIVAWWESRKATLDQANDASRDTERTTFHVEKRWVEAIAPGRPR